MTLPNNKNLSELHLKCLHTDLFQWVQFCTNYDVELSKEVTQQTYLKIIEGIARYEKLSSLKTWLFGVARITSLELLRDRKVHAIEELDRESEQERDKEPAFVVSIDHFSKRQVMLVCCPNRINRSSRWPADRGWPAGTPATPVGHRAPPRPRWRDLSSPAVRTGRSPRSARREDRCSRCTPTRGRAVPPRTPPHRANGCGRRRRHRAGRA